MTVRVGIAPDISDEGVVSVEANCTEALEQAGAEPVILDPRGPAPLAGVHALMLCGGAFDIPPDWYGALPRGRVDAPREARSSFERLALEAADAARLPVLGICGGAQLMAVCRGGTLVQDIANELPNALEHEQSARAHEPVHPVSLAEGSCLARVLGCVSLSVNSTHHQSVGSCRGGVDAVGWAPDGIVEALEDPSREFWIGVQWHPEKLRDRNARRLMDAFVRAARSWVREGTQSPG